MKRGPQCCGRARAKVYTTEAAVRQEARRLARLRRKVDPMDLERLERLKFQRDRAREDLALHDADPTIEHGA